MGASPVAGMGWRPFGAMETVHTRCAGIDIGKRSLTVCAITPGPRGEPVRETRSFGTLTSELLRLADWLAEREITTVAMEATGSYWKPIVRHEALLGP